MKIGLIDTIDKAMDGNGPNVAIAALSGYLCESHHQVGILDLFHSDLKEQERFYKKPWDLVGISASSFDFPVGLQVAREIKRRNRVPIVFGGPHTSVARGEILKDPLIDYGIYGEGEVPLLSLANLLERERIPGSAKLGEIRGLIFRNGPEIIVNPPQPRISDLNILPLPAYHLFPMHRYSEHNISTSRGCPYSCVYCASGAILGKKWIGKSPEKIVEEIEFLLCKFGKKVIVIVDDSFNLDIERVKRFCRILLERKLGISWLMMAGIRADRVDLEMLSLMRESGCMELGVGIESANPTVLNNVEKGETIEDIDNGIRLIKKAGFLVSGSLMIGNPGDTLETVKESMEYAISRGIDRVYVYHALPFPNTKLWEYVENNGRFLNRDYCNYDKHLREPVFETPEFSRSDRVKAYQMATDLFLSKQGGEATRASSGGLVPEAVKSYIGTFVDEVRSQGLRSALKRSVSFLRRRVMPDEAGITTRISRRKTAE